MLEERQRLQLFARKMLAVGLNKGFNSWLYYLEECARMRATMNRALNGSRNAEDGIEPHRTSESTYDDTSVV